MRLNKTLSVWVLIVLFALMQMGIVTHEISHLQQPNQFGQLVTSQKNSPHPDKSATHEHCEQCLAHAQANVALPSVSNHIMLDVTAYFESVAYVAYLVSVIASVYQARAPPFLK